MRLARRLVTTPLGVLACSLALLAPALRAEVLRVPQDHATIQAAVDAAVAGDEIRIAGGEYTETVTLSERSGLTLRGKGKVVFRPAPGNEGEPEASLTIEDSTDIRVDRLRFDDRAVGIEVDAGSSLRVTRCRFAGNAFAVRAVDTRNAVLANNRVDGGIVGFDLTESARVLVRGNRLASLMSVAFSVRGGSDLVFERNRVVGGGTALLADEGDTPVRRLDVAHNIFREGTGAGVRVAGEAHTVRGNLIRDFGSGVEVFLFDGDTSGLLLADNRVIGSMLTGMDLDTPSVRLRGNTVAGTQGAGVVLQQGGALLHGNRFKGNLGADVVDSAEGGEPHFFVDNEPELALDD